jgi:Flp pilus assembly pilin Flp
MRNLARDAARPISIDSDHGVRAIEIAGLIAMGIIAALTTIGSNLSGIVSYVAPKLSAP